MASLSRRPQQLWSTRQRRRRPAPASHLRQGRECRGEAIVGWSGATEHRQEELNRARLDRAAAGRDASWKTFGQFQRVAVRELVQADGVEPTGVLRRRALSAI